MSTAAFSAIVITAATVSSTSTIVAIFTIAAAFTAIAAIFTINAVIFTVTAAAFTVNAIVFTVTATTFGHFETTPSSDSRCCGMVPEEHHTKENLHCQGSMFQELWENLSAMHCQKSDYRQHSLPIH
jgi:hypothetical protein